MPRATADIDVTVEADSSAFTDAMTRSGFVLRVPDIDDFVARTRVLPFEHVRSGLPVDVVLAGPGLEETFFAGTRRVKLGRATVPVIAPEHLVVTRKSSPGDPRTSKTFARSCVDPSSSWIEKKFASSSPPSRPPWTRQTCCRSSIALHARPA